MKITIEMQGETIRKAASLLMEHYKDPEFLFNLGVVQTFNHTNDSGYALGKNIYNSDLAITIKPYSTFSPWSNVIGYAHGNTIFVNVRKIDLPLKDRIQNLFHESMHLIGYSHKGNRVNAYNLQTVPYKAALMFIRYLESIGKV
jgi:hypothetical protein